MLTLVLLTLLAQAFGPKSSASLACETKAECDFDKRSLPASLLEKEDREIDMAAKGAQDIFKNADLVNKLVAANTDFAFSLYQELSKTKAGQNLFFSPVSISTALAMTYLGAKGNTATEMKSTLKFGELDDKELHAAFQDMNSAILSKEANYTLSTANRIFARKGHAFLQAFLDGTKDFYNAESMTMDFAGDTEGSRQQINQWVEEQTNHKIKELIGGGSLSPETAMVLVNAIYFKGNWATKFNPKGTHKTPFKTGDGEQVNVQMMFQSEKFFIGMNKELDAMVLEMPYEGKDLSMFIMLPKQVGKLAELESKLTLDHIMNIKKGLRKMEVETYVPRFKLTDEFSLGDNLNKMGMSQAFQPGVADFSGIDGTNQLYISKVLHKAFIEVNEEGSEAAAATSVGIMLTSLPEIEEFRASHPFLFLIRDNRSGGILFMGRLNKPKPEE